MGTVNAAQFRAIKKVDDPYIVENPQLRLDDLKPKYEGPIKLSYMISTFNRASQLARSLETLARQNFREFEVMVHDSDSTQKVLQVCEMFAPYLNLRYFYTKRDQFRMCPSQGFKKMLPECKGEVIACAHPEMMLDEDGTFFLYHGVFPEWYHPQCWYHHLDEYDIAKPAADDWIWVTLKPRYLDNVIYPHIDSVDWHSKVSNLQKLPGFNMSTGLSNQANYLWEKRLRHPWWFCASAKKEAKVWEAMPVFQGHAEIDMWFIHYRDRKMYVDNTPLNTVCYHQDHYRAAFGPDDEVVPEIE